MRSITKTSEWANIAENSNDENDKSENDVNDRDLSTQLHDYPSSALFGKLRQQQQPSSLPTNELKSSVAAVPSARWSMRLERLEKEAREIQRLDEMRRQMMRAEQRHMRQVFQRLLENQRLLEADVIAAANASVSNKMAAASGRRRKQQHHHHHYQFVDGSIGAEVLQTQERRNRHKKASAFATSSIDVRGEKLHGDRHQQGAGFGLSNEEYYIHGGAVLGDTVTRDKHNLEVKSKRQKRTLATGGKQLSNSSSVASSSASSCEHASSAMSEEMLKQGVDQIFSVTVKYRDGVAANGPQHNISASVAGLGQGHGMLGNSKDNAIKSSKVAADSGSVGVKKGNKKTPRSSDTTYASHAFRNSGVSIPRPERGRHVTQPLRNVVVHAVGYSDERASSDVDHNDLEESNSGDENMVDNNYTEEKNLVRQINDHDQHVSTRPLRRRVKFAPTTRQNHVDSRTDDDSTFMTSVPYDSMPVRIVSYIPPDESRISKSTSCEAIIRLPPIGNQQAMTSPAQPTNKDAAADDSPLPSYRNYNSVRHQQKNANGDNWRHATRNVKDVSSVSAMLTSIRLAPKMWSVSSPRLHADDTKRSVDERTIVNYPFHVGLGKGSNMDDPNLTIVSMPLLSLYGLYSPFAGGSGQFDWPIPPARAPTFVDDAAAGDAFEVITTDSCQDQGHTMQQQQQQQHLDAADVDQAASAKRIILNVPQVAVMAEE